MKISEKRAFGELVGRKGLADRALEIAKEIVEADSYKRSIRGAGQLKVIAQACTFDDYWDEKASEGQHEEEIRVEQIISTYKRLSI